MQAKPVTHPAHDAGHATWTPRLVRLVIARSVRSGMVRPEDLPEEGYDADWYEVAQDLARENPYLLTA